MGGAEIALIMGIAGAGISAAGTIEQGKQANKAAKFQSSVQENNAKRMGYAAIQAGEQAQREVKDIEAARRRVIGQNTAAATKSGLNIGGSVIDTMTDSALAAEQDIQMAIYRGDVSAYNYANEAGSLITQSKMTRLAGKNAQTSAKWSATGSFLSNTSNALFAYENAKK